jgi:hypothetical protein
LKDNLLFYSDDSALQKMTSYAIVHVVMLDRPHDIGAVRRNAGEMGLVASTPEPNEDNAAPAKDGIYGVRPPMPAYMESN